MAAIFGLRVRNISVNIFVPISHDVYSPKTSLTLKGKLVYIMFQYNIIAKSCPISCLEAVMTPLLLQ